MENNLKSVDLKSYIEKCFCLRDQTSVVKYLLSKSNESQNYKLYNKFHSYNMLTHDTYISESEYRAFQEVSRSKFQKLIESYNHVLSDYYNNIKTYDKLMQENLRNISDQIEIERTRMSTENCDIIFFDKEVKWILIQYNEFSNILIDLELPVLKQDENFWWGKIENESYKPQQFFIDAIKKLKVDPEESREENCKQIKEMLVNKGLLDMKNVMDSNKSNYDLEKYNGDLLRKVERLSNSNPEKLKDLIR